MFGTALLNDGYTFSICILLTLGPGRPSAGGPRMDRRVVTSLGVVNVSRLASRLWRSARRESNFSIYRRGGHFFYRDRYTPSLYIPGPKMLRHSQAARNDPLIQKRYVTHRLPGMTLGSKNVTLLTWGAKWPFRCIDYQNNSPKSVKNYSPRNITRIG